ncbi:MAG: NAD+ synthetase [Cyclobacteriaceae bacterium]|nr:NAD+ synthetase [Cyclobacteriaceae bacterium]
MQKSTNLRVAGATVNQTPLAWSQNLSNIIQATEEARARQVDLLCFSELSLTGYSCEDLFLSDWLAEEALRQLALLLPHTNNITVCVGLPLRMHGKTYNGAAVLRDGKLLGVSLKQNLPLDGVHYEPRWFVPWRSGEIIQWQLLNSNVPVGDVVYTCKDITFAFEICEDAWREQRPAIRHLQRNVQLILNPSASHFAFGKAHVRETLIRTSSEKFQCAYLFVNELGNESGRMIYDGDIILAQHGKMLAYGDRLVIGNWHLLSHDLRFDTPPVNPAVTPVFPDQNEEFAQAAALALFDYLRKSKAKGFVLSLSGGADSSCCAVLVSEMVRRASSSLGWNQFWQQLGQDPATKPQSVAGAVGALLSCAYQGTRNSSPETLQSASSLATSIGAQFHQWTIDEETESYKSKMEQVLGRSLNWQQDDIALQNIQARARSPIIWMLANIKQSLLLTTSNRSEGDVGYATMDGDTSGSLAPLAGVDKPFILQWLRFAEKTLGYNGLHAVNNLTPTAELRPPELSQTDEKDLMPYPVLLAIEKLAIRDRRSPVQVFHTLNKQYPAEELKGWIRRFFKLWAINQWKRERIAPSFHFDDLNVDPRSWCRFPILSGGFETELAALDAC